MLQNVEENTHIAYNNRIEFKALFFSLILIGIMIKKSVWVTFLNIEAELNRISTVNQNI